MTVIQRINQSKWLAVISLTLRPLILLFFCAFFPQQVLRACTSDYEIWMIRDKSADPLYRFVQKGKAGYIDRFGRVVIKPAFKSYGNYGGEFHNGLLEIGLSDGIYVNTKGEKVIDKGFYRGWDFSDGLAVAMCKGEDKWGYIDGTGNFAISPRFDSSPKGVVYSFSDGLAMIEVDHKFGYINKTGEFVIKPKFLHGEAFSDDMARVVLEGPCTYLGEGPCPDFRVIGSPDLKGQSPQCKFTFIDKSGAVISSDRYEMAMKFSEGVAPVNIGGHIGFIDKKGNIVIKPIFDGGHPFSNGLALIQKGDFNGFIDHEGNIVIKTRFLYAEDFSDGFAVVSNHKDANGELDNYYYINKKGDKAFPGEFLLASSFFNGLAHVKLQLCKKSKEDSEYGRQGIFAYIDTAGKRVFTYRGES